MVSIEGQVTDQAQVRVQGQAVGHQDLHPHHHLLHQVVAEVDLGLEEDHQAHLHQANLHQVKSTINKLFSLLILMFMVLSIIFNQR